MSTGLSGVEKDKVRVKRKTIEAMLQQCQLALQQLASGCDDDDNEDESDEDEDNGDVTGEFSVPVDSVTTSSTLATCDTETAEFYGLLRSGVECVDFLKKLEGAQQSPPQYIPEDGNAWDMVTDSDVWEVGKVEPDEYVLVGQDDITEGIASFMTAYLLSLKETKDLTPCQLQEALSKTLSVKKKKSKLRKAWDVSSRIYSVASWGATAIGIYQNPAIIIAAYATFWTSCDVISKFL